MRFAPARGTPRWLGALWAAAIAALGLGRLGLGVARRPAFALTVAAALVTAFFRDPDRAAPPDGVLAAADGTVSRVDRAPDGRARIATFMGPWNVHVNRAPLGGVVRELEHRPGSHRPAFSKDSDGNERLVWTIETEAGELDLVQIAGSMARRIVPYVQAPAPVRRGERIGLIRFGSRVDVLLPAGLEPAVAVGARVRAGRTRLDRVPVVQRGCS
jgi:phosphatidylserine decarboxylase